MIDFEKEKKIYNSTEIPEKLSAVVADTIASHGRKNRGITFYLLKTVPAVACAIVCLVVGIKLIPTLNVNDAENADFDYAVQDAADTGIELARSAPTEKFAAIESAEKALNDSISLYNFAVEEKFSDSIDECVARENSSDAHGTIEEIYSDGEMVSYSVTTYPSKSLNFYNIYLSDGSDIPIEHVLEDSHDYHGCEYYFKTADEIIVVKDGKEISIDVNKRWNYDKD